MFATRVHVAAGVIVRDGCLLLARRREPPELAGAWELPGGKARRGESLALCLRRELDEELGIHVTVGRRLCTHRVREPARTLVIHALEVLEWRGEPAARVHDELAWVHPTGWDDYRVVDADVGLLECLKSWWTRLAAETRHGA